jgi:hypothetical protein
MPIAGLVSGTAVATVKQADARAASFSPDGTQLAVMSGPAWDALNCATVKSSPSTWYLYQVDGTNLTPISGPNGAPSGATDIGFDSGGRLLFAVPCGDAKTAGITGADGTPVVRAPGVYDVVVSRDQVGNERIIGVENVVRIVTPTDTDDSGVRGAVVTSDQSGTSTTEFRIPADRINFELNGQASGPPMAGGAATEIRLTPTPGSLVAFRAATNPDGTELVFFYRIRYQLVQYPVITLHWGSTGEVAFQCTADVTRDVYRVTEMDLATGIIGYQAIRGINDVARCTINCRTCSIFGGNCQDAPPDTSCAISDGFIPEGLSVTMGSR